MARRRHVIHGLLEVDVTEARRRLREHKQRTGERLSFSAFIIACVGRAVDMDRSVHAYRNWRNQLIVFDDVDILIAIEIPAGDRTFPLLHPIRAANRRSARDIHTEIRAMQTAPQRSESTLFLRWFPLLPTAVRHLIYRLVEQNPHWRKRVAGTVGLTSIGMFGDRGGWGIGAPNHTLALIVGGIARKPGVVDGQIEIREYLSVTLSVDHDVVDGAPAARFAHRLTELIESAYGLETLVEGHEDGFRDGRAGLR
ncbi:MAG TPA: dehydrogenase [Chloroflexi bacterium]|nr:dehydrogenase [Chloroflexota bacterium]